MAAISQTVETRVAERLGSYQGNIADPPITITIPATTEPATTEPEESFSPDRKVTPLARRPYCTSRELHNWRFKG
jgi:hypothetical protein